MTDDTKETETPVKKELSMSQFKAWLEGVEEMQEAGWHPTASQWKTIRAKFDMIAEPKALPPAVVTPAAPASGPMPMPAYRPPPGQAPPMDWANPPPMPEADVSPEAKALMASGGATPRTTTPNIDTTDGNFESPFG